MTPTTARLCLAEEVRGALSAGRAVVALESSVISQGLPYPTNLETALEVEAAVRELGAVPATVAVLGGRLCVGLARAQIEHLATAAGIRKASRRDLPIVVATGGDGATTVAATATIAASAGIEVFATGGIGGVHRSVPAMPADRPFGTGAHASAPDVSNDLPTLASTPVAVVCSGAKSILDLRATLEWLETAGVTVLGYGTDEFPAFYSRHSGLPVDARIDTPQQAAAIIRAARAIGLHSGTVIAVPVPAGSELPAEQVDAALVSALAEAQAQRIEGSATTPFLLSRLAHHTGGKSLAANVALLKNNAAVAARIALALADSVHEGVLP